MLADIVLPANMPWEREGLRAGFEVNEDAAALVQLRTAALRPAGESRSDAEIVFALAQRLGFGGDFWHGDLDAAMDAHLAPTGITVARLRENPSGIRVPVPQCRYRHEERAGDGWRGFETPSKLVEIWSETFAIGGYDPLPDAADEADADPAFPLLLTTAKVPHFCHAQHREIPSLRRRLPDPVAEIGALAAKIRGISDGDWVVRHDRHGPLALEGAYRRQAGGGCRVRPLRLGRAQREFADRSARRRSDQRLGHPSRRQMRGRARMRFGRGCGTLAFRRNQGIGTDRCPDI